MSAQSSDRNVSNGSALAQSPCVRKCSLDEQSVCLGCGRTLTDITSWSAASEQARTKIVHDAQERLKQMKVS